MLYDIFENLNFVDLKKTLAVLLNTMMSRISVLEQEVELLQNITRGGRPFHKENRKLQEVPIVNTSRQLLTMDNEKLLDARESVVKSEKINAKGLRKYLFFVTIMIVLTIIIYDLLLYSGDISR